MSATSKPRSLSASCSSAVTQSMDISRTSLSGTKICLPLRKKHKAGPMLELEHVFLQNPRLWRGMGHTCVLVGSRPAYLDLGCKRRRGCWWLQTIRPSPAASWSRLARDKPPANCQFLRLAFPITPIRIRGSEDHQEGQHGLSLNKTERASADWASCDTASIASPACPVAL